MNAKSDPAHKYYLSTPPLLITGMSGAGLSTAARVFEDKDWYVPQNMPPQLVVDVVKMVNQAGSPVEKIAAVTDVRARIFGGDLMDTVEQLKADGLAPDILFLDARTDVLISRFDSVRRTHPLQGDKSLSTGIERERELINPIKEIASVVIDTSELSVHDLRRRIEESFGHTVVKQPHVTIQSFGFKHGAPRDSDITIDVRFLPNPYWNADLRPFRGTDAPVANYVLSHPDAQEFVDNFLAMFNTMQDGYRHAGKNFVTVSVGCTGGHHRSVAIAEEISKRIAQRGDLDISVTHRDIDRH
ncbi:RNase adapter RapZ [Corynebacterium caspium]|uniref:RNase adapter RapZ n=1 Tax=Corynebacterium caspium TaxID=234828 RepID=UPI00036D07B4|nr:RNase adapter RapZ [Corynebacterium caspium]WKD59233.1 glmZ(sRNA)-inactivating NTPase [Corynebacterium caspium DSM 44850]